MLMHSIRRAVEALPLVINICFQMMKQSFPLFCLGPTIETVEHGLPWTKFLGKVAPRDAGSTPPQYSFQEIAVITTMAAGTGIVRQKRGNFIPLPVIKHPS